MRDRIQSALRTAGTFLGSLLSAFGRGWLYWRESTIFLPVIVLLVTAIGAAIIFLTGRQLMADISGLLDTGLTLIRIALASMITGFEQKALFGYRTESWSDSAKAKKPTPLPDDIYDASVTAFLLIKNNALVFWF